MSNIVTMPIEGRLETKEDQLNLIEVAIDNIHRDSCVQLGRLLAKIESDELWKSDARYKSFDDYCEKRWNYKPNYVYRLIKACNVYDNLLTIVKNKEKQQKKQIVRILPSVEGQIRPLTRIKRPEQQYEAWANAVSSSDRPTAKDVEKVVEAILERSKRPRQASPAASTAPPASTVSTADTLALELTTQSQPADTPQDAVPPAYIVLADWSMLSQGERESYVKGIDTDKKFNKQDGDSIEWAQWSWNPITGCRHDCVYCYARDIANRFYEQKFEPSFWPDRIRSPHNVKVPEQAQHDPSFKNVFTCSMADLFGRWVPAEWIEAVLGQVWENPQWDFLFLTKFPKRMAEFEFPKNAWMGTTIDCQVRVRAAEDAFEKISGGTKWLSLEPLLQPLKFSRLELFNWVVVGGASGSSQTPSWIPPFDWLADLHRQARDAKCRIYHKANLGLIEEMRLKEFPWAEPKVKQLPDQFKYLPGLKTA